MIGRRTLWEIFHLLLGIAAALVIAALSAWAYPLARDDIWIVATVAMVATTIMSVSPVLRAMAEDRGGQGQP